MASIIRKNLFWVITIVVVLGISYAIFSDTTLSGQRGDSGLGELFEADAAFDIGDRVEGVVVYDPMDDSEFVPPAPGQFVPPGILDDTLQWVDIKKIKIWVEDDWLWIKVDVAKAPPKNLASSLASAAEPFEATDELINWRVRIDRDRDNVTDYTIDAVWNPISSAEAGDDLSGGIFRDVTEEGFQILRKDDFPGLVGTQKTQLLTGIPLELLDIGENIEISVCVHYTSDHTRYQGLNNQVYDCYPTYFPPGEPWIWFPMP